VQTPSTDFFSAEIKQFAQTGTNVPSLESRSYAKRIEMLVRFHVLKARSMRMPLFWDVAPCDLLNRLLIDVSEVLTASIIGAMSQVMETMRGA
jgi:hypothetical protein